ncbi:MAG: dTDP-4-dehydrorhamnose 3,5-epimerase [Kofleriaceae bacterium]
MKLLPTSLPGLVLLELDVFDDDRGRLIETFRRERYLALGIGHDVAFVQDNWSSSIRGTLRGLHYQLGAPQAKLVHVTRGEVFDVAVDLRAGSPTFGSWFGAILSADNHRQMWIPAGFAHGMFVQSTTADVAYKLTAAYAPHDERSIRWSDPELAIAWPVMAPDEPRVSARDACAPLLRDAELPR